MPEKPNVSDRSTWCCPVDLPGGMTIAVMSRSAKGRRCDVTTIGKSMLGAVLAMLSAAGYTTLTAAPSRANDPVMHHVRYTVSAANPIYADIYYLDQEPAVFSDYSHNPYQFTPNVQVDIAPGKPWTYDLMLANPDQYAMVTASVGSEPGAPQFHCDLAVDGVIVSAKDGPRGVLCSLRQW
jgi:hypothetical protein